MSERERKRLTDCALRLGTEIDAWHEVPSPYAEAAPPKFVRLADAYANVLRELREAGD